MDKNERFGVDSYEELDRKTDQIIESIAFNYNHVQDTSLSYEVRMSSMHKNVDLFWDLKLCGLEYITMRDWISVMNLCKKTLVIFGIENAQQLSPSAVNSSIAISEGINLSAKYIDEMFYNLKSIAIIAAWKNGAQFGLGDDDAYYLASPSVGTASFHDPRDEIGNIILGVLNEDIPRWSHPWSGVERQGQAYEIIESLGSDHSLAREYADCTYPPELVTIRDRYLKDKTSRFTAQISDICAQISQEDHR